MSTIKSFTSLEQSRKLAEMLPLESADMSYEVREDLDGYITKTIYTPLIHTPYNDNYIPCWNLAALLNILPSATLDSSDDHHYRVHCNERFTDWYDNSVDACIAMIEKLYKLNLL